MLYWAQSDQALTLGAWWWFVPPGLLVALIGTGLVLLNFGIDELGNPRLRSGSGSIKVERAVVGPDGPHPGARARAASPQPSGGLLALVLARSFDGGAHRGRRAAAMTTTASPGTQTTAAQAGHGVGEEGGGDEPILEISDFSVVYRTPGGDVRAVDRVNLSLHAGEVVGLAGESGSGQVDSGVRLVPPPAPARSHHRRERPLQGTALSRPGWKSWTNDRTSSRPCAGAR